MPAHALSDARLDRDSKEPLWQQLVSVLRDAIETGALAADQALPSEADLIDRYHLLVFPWVLGAGKRMWSETDKDRQKLALVESASYANGVQKLCYEVVR